MKTLFAYLDLLGFKDLILHHTSLELRRIIKQFIQQLNDSVMKSREYSGINSQGDIFLGYEKIDDILEFRMLSDSILVWCKVNNERTCCILLEAIQQMLYWSFKNAHPLRGVITYGDVFLHKVHNAEYSINNESIFGKALLHAYSLESLLEWSGCIVTPQAWTKIQRLWKGFRIPTKTPAGLFNYVPLLVWYSVPFKIKNGDNRIKHIRCIALDWNDIHRDEITSDEIASCLNPHNAVSMQKSIETKNFIEYTKGLHKLYDDVQLLETIKIPPRRFTIRLGLRKRM